MIVAHYYPNREVRLTKKSVPIQRCRKISHRTNVLAVGVTCRVRPGYLALNEKTHPFPVLEFPKRVNNVIPVGFGRLPGSRHIGVPGHRKVLRSVAALECWVKEQTIDDWCVGMWTATLPGSTKEAMESLSCWSAYLMHNFRTRISRWLVRRGYRVLWCSVWEWQKRGALHLHVAVALPRDLVGSFEAFAKRVWVKLLRNVTDKSGIDLFGRSYGGTWLGGELPHCCKLVVVTSSSAGYLAKYLSKSESKRYGVMAFFCPSRWWGSSWAVKEELAKQTDCVVISQDDRCDAAIYAELVSEISQVCIKQYAYQMKYRHGLVNIFYVEEEVKEFLFSWMKNIRDSASAVAANVGQVFVSNPYGLCVVWDEGRLRFVKAGA